MYFISLFSPLFFTALDIVSVWDNVSSYIEKQMSSQKVIPGF